MSNFTNRRAAVAATFKKLCDRDDSLVRCCSVKGLSRLGLHDENTALLLRDLVKDPDPDVRADATFALGELKADCATDVLVQTLKGDPVGEVRIQATVALGKIGNTTAMMTLMDCVEEDGYPEITIPGDEMEFNPCWEVQHQALQGLALIGDHRVIDRIVNFLETSDYYDLQESGFRVLCSIDRDTARSYLAQHLGESDAGSRRRVARALVALKDLYDDEGDLPRDLMVALNRAVEDEDPVVRLNAAHALAESGKTPASLSLCRLLLDPNAVVRKEAADLLCGFPKPEIIQCLHDMLNGNDSELQGLIARILGEIGNAESAIKLIHLLESTDHDLLSILIRSMGLVGDDRVISHLTDLMKRVDDSEHTLLLTIAIGNVLSRPSDDPTRGETSEKSPADASAEEETNQDPGILLLQLIFSSDPKVSLAAMEAYSKAYADESQQLLIELLKSTGISTDVLNDLVEKRTARQDGDKETNESAIVPLVDITDATHLQLDDQRITVVEETTTLEEFLIDLPDNGDPRSSTLAAIVARGMKSDEFREATFERPQQSDDDAINGRHQEDDKSLSHQSAEWIPIQAARLLGQYRGLGSGIIHQLIIIGKHAEAPLDGEILRALGHLGNTDAAPLLVERMSDERKETRLSALDSLLALGMDVGSEQSLIDLLQDADSLVRQRTIELLAKSSSPDAAMHILKAIEDKDRDVQLAAINAMDASNFDENTSEKLVQLLMDSSGELTIEIARVLKKINDSSVTDDLLKKLNDDDLYEYHWIFTNTLTEMYAASA